MDSKYILLLVSCYLLTNTVNAIKDPTEEHENFDRPTESDTPYQKSSGVHNVKTIQSVGGNRKEAIGSEVDRPAQNLPSTYGSMLVRLFRLKANRTIDLSSVSGDSAPAISPRFDGSVKQEYHHVTFRECVRAIGNIGLIQDAYYTVLALFRQLGAGIKFLMLERPKCLWPHHYFQCLKAFYDGSQVATSFYLIYDTVYEALTVLQSTFIASNLCYYKYYN